MLYAMTPSVVPDDVFWALPFGAALPGLVLWRHVSTDPPVTKCRRASLAISGNLHIVEEGAVTGLQWGSRGNGKHKYAICCCFFDVFDGKCIQIIGLKTPGDYSASFWFNKISILLCEGPKPYFW